MQFLQKIKRFLFNFLLSRKAAHATVRKPVTLQNAKKIGILFNAENIKENDTVMAFAGQLKSMQKNIQLLGYLPKREFGFVYPFPFFTNKETNWLGIPKTGTAGEFYNTPFDLLINFSTTEALPLEYISGASLSSFRIGFNKSDENPNYDLILIPKENKEISNLIQNLEKYLK